MNKIIYIVNYQLTHSPFAELLKSVFTFFFVKKENFLKKMQLRKITKDLSFVLTKIVMKNY